MNHEEKQGYLLNDLLRKISNIIRVGNICEVDYAKAKARVKIGELKTAMLSWITSAAGETIDWKPLTIGEQVIVLSPGGELERGVILPALYQSLKPAPDSSKDKQKVVFGDGSIIEYDTKEKNLFLDLKGKMNIIVKGSANIEAETVNVEAKTVNVESETANIEAKTANIETTNIDIKGKTTITGDITLQGNTIIAGNTIVVGNMSMAGGGKPVARFGDKVSVDPITHIGTIIEGSSTVKSG